MAPYFKFKSQDGLFAATDTVDWTDFKNKTSDFLRHSSEGGRVFERFLFRGQSCSSWVLESGFDRRYAGVAHVDKDARYKSIMAVFANAYRMYGATDRETFNHDFRAGSDSGEAHEMLAQHFGLPSRLLDWSKSLYVGAFFAFSRIEECKTDLVSVWILDKKAAQSAISQDHVTFHESVYKENRRQLWQMGAFTRNKTDRPNFADLFVSTSSYVKATRGYDTPMLVRFDLPKSSVKEAFDDLDMMRINALTLFPGIDGVVRWIERGGYALKDH